MSARQLAIVGRTDLTRGELAARTLRHRFQQAGVFVASAASSPGAGKTALFERTLEALVSVYQIAAIAADPATDRDAARLARRRVPVRQITTGAAAQLDAGMVARVLDGWNLTDLDFLLIENVGNLICSSSSDLGEDLRVVLVSVTECEDTPLSTRRSSSARMLRSSPRWTWRMPPVSTARRCTRTLTPCAPGSPCSRCRRRPVRVSATF